MDIRIYLVKNTTETAASAPYTWRVIPNGVANLNDVVAGILERISSSEERVRMALAEAQKVALKHVLAGETVDFGGIRLKAQIPGSSPYEDSPFDPATDAVNVCAYIDDELRDTFDGISPVKVSAAEFAQSIKVSNIMDVATEQFGTVVGATEFYVLGNGITIDGEGEYVKAYDKKTGVLAGTAQVISVSKGQRAKCKFNPQLAGGDYILEIATKGLIGETTPRVFRKAVTAIAVPEPTPIDQTPDGKVKVYSATDDGQSETFTYGHTWLVNGAGMFVGLEENGWRIQDVKAVANESHEPELSWTTSADGKTLTLTKNGSAMPVPAGSYPGAKIKVTLAKDAAGSETYALQIPINLVVPE